MSSGARGPMESGFDQMWTEACDAVDAEEAMIVEHTTSLERRIAQLETALDVFVEKMDCGCVYCFFQNLGECHSKDDYCLLPDDDRRPCRMGWKEWALEEGKRRDGG